MKEASHKRPREEKNSSEDERPAKRFIACDYNEMVTVLIGPKKETFVVHRDLISSKSSFFEAACSQRWKEGLEKTIRMPEAESEVFRAYVAWVYSNDISVAQVRHNEPQTRQDQRLIMELYLFGDFVGDRALCKETIRLLVSLSKVWRHQNTATSLLTKIWASTMPASPLRRVVVDRMMLRLDAEGFADQVGRLPAEVVQDLAVALMRQRDTVSANSFAARLDEYLDAEDKRP